MTAAAAGRRRRAMDGELPAAGTGGAAGRARRAAGSPPPPALIGLRGAPSAAAHACPGLETRVPGALPRFAWPLELSDACQPRPRVESPTDRAAELGLGRRCVCVCVCGLQRIVWLFSLAPLPCSGFSAVFHCMPTKSPANSWAVVFARRKKDFVKLVLAPWESSHALGPPPIGSVAFLQGGAGRSVLQESKLLCSCVPGPLLQSRLRLQELAPRFCIPSRKWLWVDRALGSCMTWAPARRNPNLEFWPARLG